MGAPLALAQDVADIWPAYKPSDETRVDSLILKASARLREKAPFDIDTRIGLPDTDPNYLDPLIVADVVANIVKRVLVNPDGVLSGTETAGPYSRSKVFASRTSDTGETGSTLTVTPADIDALRVSQPTSVGSTIRVQAGPRPRGFADGDPWIRHRCLP